MSSIPSIAVTNPKIDADLARAARRIVAAALAADSDARTVLKLLSGGDVKPGAARRITRALAEK